MPRPRQDGTSAAPPNRVLLTELAVRKLAAVGTPVNVWDKKERLAPISFGEKRNEKT
jgi:hypothetical protein